jgi:hypothetical protein
VVQFAVGPVMVVDDDSGTGALVERGDVGCDVVVEVVVLVEAANTALCDGGFGAVEEDQAATANVATNSINRDVQELNRPVDIDSTLTLTYGYWLTR